MDMKTYLNKLLSMTKKHINNSQLKAKFISLEINIDYIGEKK